MRLRSRFRDSFVAIRGKPPFFVLTLSALGSLFSGLSAARFSFFFFSFLMMENRHRRFFFFFARAH
jgi:hypothetical protein